MSTTKPMSTALLTILSVLIILTLTILIIAFGIICTRCHKSHSRKQDIESQRAQEMTTFHVNHQALREEQQRRARARLRAQKLGFGEGEVEVRPEDFPLPPSTKPETPGTPVRKGSVGMRHVMPTVEEVQEELEAPMPPLPPPVYSKTTAKSPRPSKFKEHLEDDEPSCPVVEKIVAENGGEGFEDVCLDDGDDDGQVKSSAFPSHWGRPLPSWGRG